MTATLPRELRDPAHAEQLERLAKLIEKTIGNVISRGQLPHLEQIALERAAAVGDRSLESYVDRLEQSGFDREWRHLLPDITIKESFLFRVPEQFQALGQKILPELKKSRDEAHCFHIWSAGCARGEEPTTIALVLAESPYLVERPWEVLATDVDDDALALAQRAEFGERAVAHVPPHLLRAYFEPRRDQHRLDRKLLEHIEFRNFNFVRSPYLGLGPLFDVIFLRNVLIYFSPEAQNEIVGRVLSRLAPDGYLFLGHSESLWKIRDDVESLEFGDCFAYRKRDPKRHETTSPGPARLKIPRRPSGTGAKERAKRTVAKTTPPPLPATTPEPSKVPTPSLPPPDTEPGPRPHSTAAIAAPCSNLGEAAQALADDDVEEAQAIVALCLSVHPTNTLAHAIQGLIRDLRGHADDAVTSYRAALFVEDGLYQIRFLLAHRLEFLGWPSRAKHEYRRVLTDLENGGGRPLDDDLPGLLPQREEIAQRCRRALNRL